jgi:4a-hydroxytetrahydrobiopterin dehydratase
VYVSGSPHAKPGMATKLSDIEVQRALGARSGWTRRGNAITRTFEFPTFPDAIAFVDRIAVEAEKMDHHPDIDIRYTKVTCSLSTHSAGGITQKDFKLAEEIDKSVNSES